MTKSLLSYMFYLPAVMAMLVAFATPSVAATTLFTSPFDWDHARDHLDLVKQSLMNSSWPADHGDVARSKFTLGAGLPKHFDPSKLRVHTQTDLPHAQWLYTYGNNSEWLYVINGPYGSFFLSKVNSTTLEVVQQIPLEPSLYMGGKDKNEFCNQAFYLINYFIQFLGLLMHASGHVFCVHANKLYRFWQGDLYNVSKFYISTDLNGYMVQTNGMLVTSDGHLVVKQWAFNLEDSLYVAGRKNYIILFVVAILLAFFFLAIYYFMQKKRNETVTKWQLAKVLSLLLVILFPTMLCVLNIIIIRRIVGGPFSSWKFLTNNLVFANGGGGSELKLIDPLSLKTVAELKLAERCSYPRLAMSYVKNEVTGEDEDAIVVVGDENVYQVRWNPKAKELYMVS